MRRVEKEKRYRTGESDGRSCADNKHYALGFGHQKRFFVLEDSSEDRSTRTRTGPANISILSCEHLHFFPQAFPLLEATGKQSAGFGSAKR